MGEQPSSAQVDAGQQAPRHPGRAARAPPAPRPRAALPLDFAPLDKRRRADIVFTRRKIAIFIDGCFWHGCPLHYVQPKTNAQYWWPKIERNIERDRENTRRLGDAGWTVARFWEHEDPAAVADAITELVR